MKITLNWLKQYVDFDYSPDQLAERLTMLGIEVEGMHKLAGEFEGVVVAQVITRDKHPNADKLSLCRVNDGKSERQIVCGADNFKPGDKVPLILPGASLPAKAGESPLTIKIGRIRGVESQGMMCSPQELGLGDLVEGLLILREDARVGQSFAEYLGRSGTDVLYDLEITPNRPDWSSVIGIAREISAITGNPLKIPNVEVKGGGTAVSDLVAVRIEDPELCPRYTARIVRGLKIGASPDWLKSTLEKVGIRSINNVVDVTNYVMLEIGQPLHAFDYHLLQCNAAARASIIIRRAAQGEKFVTLDGQERTLTTEMLLIADETKGIALAGIMGGQNSEIRSDTVDVLIESAYFKPQNIRATSKRLGLRTESSYRFERGADPGICEWASQRSAQLIIETAGGQLVSGVIDEYPYPVEQREISLRADKANQLLGIQMRPEQMEIYLHQLGLKAASRKPRPVDDAAIGNESLRFRIPSFRVDLKREIDLIEEIVRLYGVDNIPPKAPRGAIGINAFDRVHDELSEARQILIGAGLFEAQGQTLISSRAAKWANDPSIVSLANPLSSDMDVLRPSLLPGLLDSLRHNVNHKNNDVALFELGRVFASAGPDAPAQDIQNRGPAGIVEERRLAIALTGQREPLFWKGEERGAKFDVYDLKGVLEEFFDQFGLRGVTYSARVDPTSVFIESATIHLGKFQLGEFGQLLTSIAKQQDLRDAVFLAELKMDILLARRNPARSFKALPVFPPIRRDVAMLVPEATTHESVLQAVKQAKPANLETVELFDVFRGKNIPSGQKSMAYAFTYRNPERTLTDGEINASHQKLVEHFKQKLHAIVRE